MADDKTATQGTTVPAEQQATTQAQPAAPVQPAVTAPAAQPAAPAVTTPAAPAAPTQSKADEVTLPREAFNARIASAEQAAQRRVWESLGKDEAEIKALLEAEAARADAQKTLEQRVAERDAQLVAERAKVGEYLKTLSERCDLEMGLLSEAQKAAVIKLGGDDPAKRLAALDALWPTWNAQPATQPATAAAATQQPAITPAAPAAPVETATAPDPNAPGDGSPTSPPDHVAVYRDLKSRNPFEAAEYARAHPDVWGGMVR